MVVFIKLYIFLKIERVGSFYWNKTEYRFREIKYLFRDNWWFLLEQNRISSKRDRIS